MPRPIQKVTAAAAPAVTLLHGGALGDFVLAVQWLCRLQVGDAAHGRAVVARSPMSALPPGALPIDALLDADTVQLHRIFSDDAPMSGALTAQLAQSALVFDMITRGDAAAVGRLREAAGGPVVSIDPSPIPRDHRHITEQWTAKVRAAGVQVSQIDPITAWFESCRKKRPPAALLHPGSGGRAKCWPIDRFIALAQKLIAAAVDVHFIVGPTELDWHGRSWTDPLAAITPVICESDLQRFGEHMAAADLYVGNDAGATHLAAAAGTPTLAMFGPTDPAVWRPIGPSVCMLAAADAPNAAMDGLSLERVFAACLDMISKSATPTASTSES